MKIMKIINLFAALALSAGLLTTHAHAEGTFTTKSLTPELAVKLAQATLAACRAEGFQIAVAVVDKGGNAQALIRDRFAGPHTPRTATLKAYTAVSFRANTLGLSGNSQAGKEASGVRDIPGVLMLGGGVVIETAGELIGGVGVSGAPGGALDEACAMKGLEAIADDLAF